MVTQELQLTKSEMVRNENFQDSAVLSREWQTLALGFADGLGKTASTTAADIKQGALDFCRNPVSASGDFLKNHWIDAAAGAAITFLRPTKLANAALVALSLRGAGQSTYETFVAALDPHADLNKLRSGYADEISHQGTAFLYSMPMALLGGNIGRAGANALFGKNLGALDLVSGKVPLSDVKNNLWAIHDTIKPPPVKLVVTDMDNTLAAHGRYFSEGIKKAISDLSVKTKIPEGELYKSIGNQMENFRSHDYPWSVEIALKDRLNVGKEGGMSTAQFHEQIVKPFWETIDKALTEHHRTYPGVVETLTELKRRDIPVAVLSDAPAYIGLKRLSNLGLQQGLVDRFYGLHNWAEPVGLTQEMLSIGKQRVNSMLMTEHGLSEFKALPAAWEKPETSGFEALLRAYKVRPAETLMIGDSRVKDVGVAHKAGARAIWAKYGQPVEADEAVLTRLRPLPENNGGVAAKGQAAPKKYAPYLEAADSYESVLSHLNPKANYSELAAQSARSLWVRPEFKAALGAYNFVQPEVQSRK